MYKRQVLTAACCPSCVGFLKGPAFNRFTLDGGVEVFPSELFDGAKKTDCYVSPEDYKALTENSFVLGKAPVPLFYGAACQDVNTIGGFANWVQDCLLYTSIRGDRHSIGAGTGRHRLPGKNEIQQVL